MPKLEALTGLPVIAKECRMAKIRWYHGIMLSSFSDEGFLFFVTKAQVCQNIKERKKWTKAKTYRKCTIRNK